MDDEPVHARVSDYEPGDEGSAGKSGGGGCGVWVFEWDEWRAVQGFGEGDVQGWVAGVFVLFGLSYFLQGAQSADYFGV